MHATNVRIRTLATHTGVQRALFHIWQSLETRGQIIKMASSSESSDEADHLIVLLFSDRVDVKMLENGEKKWPTNEEERVGVELALKYRSR